MKNLIAGLIDGKTAVLKVDNILHEECTVYAYRSGKLIGIFPEHSLAYLYITEDKHEPNN